MMAVVSNSSELDAKLDLLLSPTRTCITPNPCDVALNVASLLRTGMLYTPTDFEEFSDVRSCLYR